VQGVGFRFAARGEAERLGLTGWVRNTLDRTVEACFEGDEEAVNAMIDWCHRGPSMARVSQVDVAFARTRDTFEGFRITG
jgi:acylphosphatase